MHMNYDACQLVHGQQNEHVAVTGHCLIDGEWLFGCFGIVALSNRFMGQAEVPLDKQASCAQGRYALRSHDCCSVGQKCPCTSAAHSEQIADTC